MCKLWDELADFDASRVDEALVHAMAALATLVSARNVFWLGAVRLAVNRRDPLRGWRPRAIRYLDSSELNLRFARHATREVDSGQVDESVRGNVRRAGTFRAHLLRDLVPAAWYALPFYDVAYRARGVADAMFVITPVTRDAESYFGFHRGEGQPPFTTRDRDLAAYALRGLKWFHRQVLLSHGLLAARAPLSAAEQRVLRLLLTSLSEKEVAARLGLTVRTTHAYVTAIFRKFGVRGRAGLTALWLGHLPRT